MKTIQMYLTSDDKPFQSPEAAKAHEIALLPDLMEPFEGHSDNERDLADRIGGWIVTHAEAIIAILTDKPVKKARKVRSDKGVKKAAVLA